MQGVREHLSTRTCKKIHTSTQQVFEYGSMYIVKSAKEQGLSEVAIVTQLGGQGWNFKAFQVSNCSIFEV